MNFYWLLKNLETFFEKEFLYLYLQPELWRIRQSF